MVKCLACSCSSSKTMKKKEEAIGWGIIREFYKCPECGFEFHEKNKKHGIRHSTDKKD